MIAFQTGINRNIVECKVRNMLCTGTQDLVLIETLWNVKIVSLTMSLVLPFVLIETLWNIKQQNNNGILWVSGVLIETLWNVKKVETAKTYFVELKY